MAVIHGIRTACALALATSSPAPALLAGNVLVVDASGGGAYTAIQPAITAAVDGDTILVKSGAYPSFVVGNKSLAVVGDTGAGVQVDSGIRVRNLAAGKTVVLANLTANGSGSGVNIHGLYLDNNMGSVRVEGCAFFGAPLTCFSSGCPRGDGVHAESCLDVALVACTAVGGLLDSVDLGSRAAGAGLWEQASTVAVYDSIISGGQGAAGGDSYQPHGDGGGNGASLSSATLFASGSAFQGGHGGDAGVCSFCLGCGCSEAGNGGNGVAIASGSARLLDTDTLPGIEGSAAQTGCCSEDGYPGMARVGFGFIDITGTARKLVVPTPVRENAVVAFRFFGAPGESVHLMVASLTQWRLFLAWKGVLLILPNHPHWMTTSLGTIPAGGTLNLQLPIVELAPGEQSRVLHYQPVFIAPNGTKQLGTPASLVILDQAF